MGLLKRGKQTPQAPRKTDPGADGRELGLLDRCMDSFAAVLRAWRDHPIDLPDRPPTETREQCEAWARHVLLASPPPGDERALPAGSRDFIGLERFFRALRQEEHAYVTATVSELRQVVWVCIQALGRAGTADTRSDSKIAGRIQTLRAASQSQDLDLLRREVTSMVCLLDSEIESRRARQQTEVEQLSTRLQHVTAALITEKRNGELDALTQVYGRATMDEHIGDLCEMAQVVTPTAVAFLMDVDHFKWVNDRFGHGVGDEVLKRVAARLREQFRRSGDFVARYGGDEFVAIVNGGSLDIADQMGERALQAIREIEVEHEGESVRVAVSIGIAALRQGESTREWLDRADKALYASKDAGRDRATVAERM